MDQGDTKASRRFPPLPVRAILRDIKTDAIVAEHDFDFNSQERRRWFNEKLCVWAFLNPSQPCSVEILKVSDDA